MPKGIHEEWMVSERLSPDPFVKERAKEVVVYNPISGKAKRGWRAQNRRSLALALENKYELPGYCFREHQAKADRALPKPNAPSARDGSTISLGRGGPVFITDAEGGFGILYIPEYVRAESLTNLSEKTQDYMETKLDSYMRKIRERLRGNQKWFKVEDGRFLVQGGVFGQRHFALMWHPTGHQYSDCATASNELACGTSSWKLNKRLQFVMAMDILGYRTDHLLRTFYRQFSDLLRSVHPWAKKNPLSSMLSGVWQSDFLGHAVLCNKQSWQHLDVNGVRRGVDILVAAGEFSGGSLYLKDIDVRIPFLPGDLIAFDGTAQRHAIEEFSEHPDESGVLQRYSHVLFVHRSVFQEANIDTSLPDLTLQGIRDNIALEASEAAPAPPKTTRPIPPPPAPRGKRKGPEFNQGPRHRRRSEFPSHGPGPSTR